MYLGPRVVFANDVGRPQVHPGESDEVRQMGQHTKRQVRRPFIARLNCSGVPHRLEHCRRRDVAQRTDTAQLRKVEIQPPVKRLHDGAQVRLRPRQRSEVLPLCDIEHLLEHGERLRRRQVRQNLADVGSRPLDFVNGFTAEGIYYAMVSGELAARTVAADWPSMAADLGDPYRRAVDREMGAELRDSVLVQRYLFGDRRRIAAAIAAAPRQNSVTKLILDLAIGRRSYADVRRRMFARLPLLAARLLWQRLPDSD